MIHGTPTHRYVLPLSSLFIFSFLLNFYFDIRGINGHLKINKS